MRYLEPNLEKEWNEAERYPEFVEMGKHKWLKLKGKPVRFSTIEDKTGNVNLNFKELEKDKKDRFYNAYDKGVIELPIVVKFNDNDYDLVAGNTRIAGLKIHKKDPFVWLIDMKNIKNKETEVDEITGASSAGAFSSVPAFGDAPTKLRKINNMENKKIEATEATDASSSGSYSSVPFGGKNTKGGRRNPLKIDGPDSIYKNRAVKDKNWPKFGGPGGYYVKPKEKCEKFPYCNQGNTGALEFIHENYDDLKVAITETANKLGVPYNTVQKIVLNEIKQIFI